MSYRDCLHTFLTVYRLGAQSKAADALALTQPAVSQHLKILEQYLGRPLFQREGRSLQPTAVAHQLAHNITEADDTISTVLASMRQGEQQLQGEVYVGGLSEFFSKMIMPHMEILSEYDIQLRFIYDYDGLEEKLLKNEIGLAQFVHHVTHPQITVEKLYHQKFVLVGHPKFKSLINNQELDQNNIRCLLDLPWITYSHTLLFIKEYFHTVFQQEFQGKLKLVISDLWAILEAVRAGFGVSVLSNYFCQEYLDNHELEILYETDKNPSHFFYLGWKQGALRDPKLKFVYELYKNACAHRTGG